MAWRGHVCPWQRPLRWLKGKGWYTGTARAGGCRRRRMVPQVCRTAAEGQGRVRRRGALFLD
jgi:hypothetical protein